MNLNYFEWYLRASRAFTVRTEGKQSFGSRLSDLCGEVEVLLF